MHETVSRLKLCLGVPIVQGAIPLLECQHLLEPQFKTDDFRMYKLKVLNSSAQHVHQRL